MKAKETYRKAFLVLRQVLQIHDPLGLMQLHSGDRFEAETYGYEATTIIERFHTRPTVEGITDFLRTHADNRGYERKEEDIIASAEACTDVLTSC